MPALQKRKASLETRRTSPERDRTEIVIRVSRENVAFSCGRQGGGIWSITKVRRGYHETCFDPVQGWIAFK